MMKRSKVNLIAILVVVTIPLVSMGSSPAMHMYIGSQTHDIWSDFDPMFTELLNTESYWGHMTRKFYYVGLTIPDMIDEQAEIRSLLEKLNESKDYLNTSLHIENSVVNVASEMIFRDSPPNSNMDMMRKMALWVRDYGTSPYEKALVYGAYMHTIHDLFAHYVLQPSLFGYGNSLVAQFEDGDGIHVSETYYEIFSQSHIPSDGWGLLNDVYSEWQVNYVEYSIPPSWGYFELYREIADNGTEACNFTNYENNNVLGDSHFRPILRFVEAAENVLTDQGLPYALSLNYSSLKSHIQGWAILMFFFNGYRQGHESADAGWFLGDENWSVSTIRENYIDMVEPYLGYGFFESVAVTVGGWYIDILDYIIDNLLGWGSLDQFMDVFILVFASDYYISSADQPWPYFLETVSGYNEIEGFLPAELFAGVGQTLPIWVTYSDAQTKPPNKQASYWEEISKMLNFYPQIKSLLDGIYEPFNLNWSLSRKAGLAGGLVDWATPIDEAQDYFGQPGVNKLNFVDHNGLAFEITNVWPFAPYNGKSLEYDLVTFGNTLTGIYGTSDDETPLVETFLSGVDRYTDVIEIDAYEAASTNTGLAFQTKTEGKVYGGYEKMMNSNYRQAYENLVNTAGIPTSVVNAYGQYFNDGFSTREWDENPVEKPTEYWPYVLGIVDGIGLPQVSAFFSAPEGIQLKIRDATYYDGSGYPNVFKPLGANYQVYLDAPVETYSIRAPLLLGGNSEYDMFGSWTVTQGSAVLDNPNNRTTGVIFQVENTSIEASYNHVTIAGEANASLFSESGSVYLKVPKSRYNSSAFENYSGYTTQGSVTLQSVSAPHGYEKYEVTASTNCTITLNYTEIGVNAQVFVSGDTPVPLGSVIEMPQGSSIDVVPGAQFEGTEGSPIILRGASGTTWDGLDTYTYVRYLTIEDADRAVEMKVANTATKNLKISNCSFGFYLSSLEGSLIQIKDCEIVECVNGIYAVDSWPIDIVGTLISDCQQTGVSLDFRDGDIEDNVYFEKTTITNCLLGLKFQGNRQTILTMNTCIVAFNDVGYSFTAISMPLPTRRDYCDFYNTQESSDLLFRSETNCISSNPLFVDRTNGNYHLKSNSPCIDRGDPNPDLYDPDNTVADMGAFYRDANDAQPSPPTNLILFVVPEPFNGNPKLDWNSSPSPDIWGYEVYRRLDNGSWSPISGLLPASTTTYIDYEILVSGKFGDDYYYHVKAVDWVNNKSTPSNIVHISGQAHKQAAEEENVRIPEEYALHGNYPNPFNPTTNIRYDLPEASYVSLMIYDILGREVRTLLDSRVDAGFKSVVWDGRDDTGNSVSTGIYIYVLKAWSLESAKTYHKTEKMVLLR